MPTNLPTPFPNYQSPFARNIADLVRAKERVEKIKATLFAADHAYRAASANFGGPMKLLLKRLRIKQSTLAKRVGESSSVVSQRLSGFLAFTPDLATQYLNAITQDHRA